MITTVSSVVGLFGLVISIGLLAWQTREVAKQTKISNAIARISAVNQNSEGLRAVLDHFVREPALRPYFYEGVPLPKRGRRRHQILSIAEEFGDVLNEAIVTFSTIADAAGFRQRADWLDYCQTMLITCPTLADLSTLHPAWWPELSELAARRRYAAGATKLSYV
jgi:hypothetical protein